MPSNLADRIIVALVVVLAASNPCFAQETTVAETWTGELSFENGYPSKQAVTKLYDELDFQRATQAYIWGLPIVSMAVWQEVTNKTFGAGNGDIVVYRTYRDKLGLMVANNTTPYIVSFIDLGQTGPLIFDLPPGPNASVIDDMWQRPIEDFGQTGPDKQQGGKFLILGPGQVDPRDTTGANADSEKYFVLRSPTFNVCFFFRSLDSDLAKGQQWIENLRFYSYDQRANPPASKILTPGGKPWSQTQPRGLAYWESLASIIKKEPVIERDRMMMGMLKPLGIEKGKTSERGSPANNLKVAQSNSGSTATTSKDSADWV